MVVVMPCQHLHHLHGYPLQQQRAKQTSPESVWRDSQFWINPSDLRRPTDLMPDGISVDMSGSIALTGEDDSLRMIPSYISLRLEALDSKRGQGQSSD